MTTRYTEDKTAENQAFSQHLALTEEVRRLNSQVVQSLGVLNGGGAIAMLGLLQALVLKTEQFRVFKPFGLSALAAFAIGALISPMMLYARYHQSLWVMVDGDKVMRHLWANIVEALLVLSICSFLGACFSAGLGLYKL